MDLLKEEKKKFALEMFFDQIQKQKDQRLPHDKPDLLSMALHDRLTKFIITLNAMPCLNDTHVVFGEVTNGMDLLYLINQKGIRDVGKQIAAAAAVLENDNQIRDDDPNFTGAQISDIDTTLTDAQIGAQVKHARS